MDCPKCNTPLKNRDIGDVSVDECPRCKGIWFDKNEIAEAKDEIDPDLRWMDLRIFRQEPRFNVTAQPYDCPNCSNIPMQAIIYQEPNIDVEYCPACEGTWFNAGDLEKIIDALGKEADSMSVPDYVKDSLKEAAEIITHPTDLISEWKDLKSVLRLLKYRIFVENPRLKNILLGIQKSLPL